MANVVSASDERWDGDVPKSLPSPPDKVSSVVMTRYPKRGVMPAPQRGQLTSQDEFSLSFCITSHPPIISSSNGIYEQDSQTVVLDQRATNSKSFAERSLTVCPESVGAKEVEQEAGNHDLWRLLAFC